MERPETIRDRDPRGRRAARDASAGPADEVCDPVDRVLGLLPRLEVEEAAGHARAGSRGKDLQAGDEERRPAGRRNHEHREPFERHRIVSGEVGEVRAHAHENRPKAVLRHPGLCPRQSLAEARGRYPRAHGGRDGDGRDGSGHLADTSVRAGMLSEPAAGAGTPSHAASTAWPFSKRVR